MTDERKSELFDNAITWIWAHTENFGMETYILALKEVGYTQEEITEELTSCNFDDEHNDDFECPLGGDETNDCADCAYAGDFHFVNGECVRREE